MQDFASAKWQPTYQEALLKTNLDSIGKAESAIYARLTELINVSEDQEERVALGDALSMLRVLRTKISGAG